MKRNPSTRYQHPAQPPHNSLSALQHPHCHLTTATSFILYLRICVSQRLSTSTRSQLKYWIITLNWCHIYEHRSLCTGVFAAPLFAFPLLFLQPSTFLAFDTIKSAIAPLSFASQSFSSILTTHWNNFPGGVWLYFQTPLDWLALRSFGPCLMLCSHICSSSSPPTSRGPHLHQSTRLAACTFTHSCHKLCKLVGYSFWFVWVFF